MKRNKNGYSFFILKFTLSLLILLLIVSQVGITSYANVSPWAQKSVDLFRLNFQTLDFLDDGKKSSEKINREEFAELICKAYIIITGIKEHHLFSESRFMDTNSKWVAIANHLGLISGTAENLYSPKKNITREEIAIVLYALNERLLLPKPNVSMKKIIDYTDISSWAIEGVQFCVDTNLINGLPNGKILPKENASREQAIVMVSNFITKANDYANNKKITIEDAHLRERASINLSVDINNITLRDAYRLIDLEADNRGVTSLEGVQYFVNLHFLNVPNNNIANVEKLAYLHNLEVLDLTNNKVENIDSIKNCVNLVFLRLSNNKIKVIPDLSKHTRLAIIEAGNNSIESLSTISAAPNLERLSLENNDITSLLALKKNKTLVNLNLDYNKLTNLEGLAELGYINSIDLNGNKFSDVDILNSISEYKGYISLMNMGFTSSSFPVAVKMFEEVKKATSIGVSDSMNDFEKAKAIHDYIVLNTSYDYDNYLLNKIPFDSYSVYGVLVKRRAVCEGYAKTYNMLLREVGIESYYVSGKGNGKPHAWNYVVINGTGYHVDTTWDDPVPDRAGYVRHKYFMLSDDEIAIDHSDWIIDYE